MKKVFHGATVETPPRQLADREGGILEVDTFRLDECTAGDLVTGALVAALLLCGADC
jgi:hypothetical protein